MIGLLLSDGAEAAQVGLQVGHQERGGDAFAGDVCNHKAETILAEVEKVVIIATDLAGLDADTGVFQSVERRQSLREEAGLDVFGDFEFVSGAALGFLLCGDSAALRFHGVGQLVEADEREGIAVDIAEASDDAAPDRSFFAEEHTGSAGDAGVCTLTCG